MPATQDHRDNVSSLRAGGGSLPRRLFEDARRLYDYRELLRNLVAKELKLRFRGTWLGAIWSLLHPFLLVAIYWLVFENVIRFDVSHYALLLLVGIFHWQASVEVLQKSAQSILGNQRLIQYVPFPHIILPLANIAFALVQLLFALVILVPVLIIYQTPISWSLWFYVPAVALHMIFTLGLTLGLTGLCVFYRDLEHLSDVAFRMLFWLTPIIYPFSVVPEALARILQFSPFVPFFRTYQDILYQGVIPDLGRWVLMFGWAFFALVVGYAIFRRYQPRFAEEV